MRNRTRAVAASVAAILLAGMCRGLPAAPPAEADKRLQADGKGWRLSKADVKDPSRPRVLLMG
ncbi:MAG TPA: hypothetical protein PKG77_26205, partial [Phycisphaerae bacterium]|nr:hypothetical protein [Phycisphaerae bacterium]